MSAAHILKIGVLADGSLLLDGQPTTLSAIAQAMDRAAPDCRIWYYREHAEAKPHPAAMEVMQLITGRRLPVRLSSLPDFSDSVTAEVADVEKRFAAIRERAAQRILVILRPDGRHLQLPVLKPQSASPEAVAAMERLLPSTIPRNVAVIADTGWTMAGSTGIRAANRAIPFFGLLMGLASIGHTLWIFDAGAEPAITAGCRLADVLIVDSARLPALPPRWQAAAAQGMRGRQILIHDRASHTLRPPAESI